MFGHTRDIGIPSFIEIPSEILEPQGEGGWNLVILITLAFGFYNVLYYGIQAVIRVTKPYLQIELRQFILPFQESR